MGTGTGYRWFFVNREFLDAAARASKATRPRVTYQWPHWVEDLKPNEKGAQPGFDVRAMNPYARPDDDPSMRYVRLHLSPGLDSIEKQT